MRRRLTSGELATNVPVQLQQKDRWVGHKAKQPIDVVGGGLASTSNPATWATFGQALEWYDTHAGEDPSVGIGFVFTAGDGLVFVDLDHALDDAGQVKGWADPLVNHLTSTYMEVSPSGKGLHAFLVSELPRAEGVTGARVAPPGATGSEKIEVYADRRFSTVTGWRYSTDTGWSVDPPAFEAVPVDLTQLLYETGLGEKLLRGDRLTPREEAPVEPVDLAQIRGALGALDPDCSYEEWLQIGMALKSGLDDDGFGLWDEWSARGRKYQPGEPERKWGSFRRSGVGLGTLFHRALEAGWAGKRDALAEFAGVEVEAAPAREVSEGEIPYHVKSVGFGKRAYDEIVRSDENAYLYFSRDVKWQGRIRWNERRGEVELDGKALRDHDLVDLGGAVARALDWNGAGPDLVFRSVVRAAQADAYDPVRDWLKGLEWDGVGRLDRFCADVGLEDSEATRRYIRLWLLGAVARAFDPGCSMPYVLVLCGPQGAGKSRLAQALAVKPAWYHESAVTLGDKDAYLATLGPWVFEIAELAGMRRTDQEKVKAFVSEKESKFRAPYGRVQETHPRRLVFIATTNDEEYGRDSTGARRWLDVAVTGEMRIPTESEIEQLWAEAVVCYQRGDRRYETAEEMAETNARGEGRREIDPVELAAVEEVRQLAREGGATVSEVLDRLRARNVQLGYGASRAVSNALKAAGWERRQLRIGDARVRAWVAPGASVTEATEAIRRTGYRVTDN